MSDSVRKSSAKRPIPLDEKMVVADDLKKAGEEILGSYKVLEEAWKKAEEKLLPAHVPSNVKVEVDYQTHAGGEDYYYLGYGKIKGQWKICLVEDTIHPDEEREEDCDYGKWTPIAEASVYWRMEMIKHFPALAAEVVAVTRKYVNDIKKQAADFEKSLTLFELL